MSKLPMEGTARNLQELDVRNKTNDFLERRHVLNAAVANRAAQKWRDQSSNTLKFGPPPHTHTHTPPPTPTPKKPTRRANLLKWPLYSRMRPSLMITIPPPLLRTEEKGTARKSARLPRYVR